MYIHFMQINYFGTFVPN